MHGLTGRQGQVLDYIRHYMKTNLVPPTIREIAVAFSIQPRAAFDHVKALTRKGSLTKHGTGRQSRSIRLAPDIPAALNPSLNGGGKAVHSVLTVGG